MDINKLTSKIKGEPKAPFVIKPVSKGVRSQGYWTVLLIVKYKESVKRNNNIIAKGVKC